MDAGSGTTLADPTMLVGIDDTDTIDSEYGTGKVSRLLGAHLAEQLPDLRWTGSVRQQLLVDPRVPYTTHNSAATLLCEVPSTVARDDVIAPAASFLEEIAADGSDPGLCVGRRSAVTDAVREFGVTAGTAVVGAALASELARASGLFLSE